MTEVKYFHCTLILTDLVVNHYRTMQQLANARPFSDGFSQAWKTSWQVHVVEQSIAKTRSRSIVVFGNVADDLGEVF
jgi:hypothetical protein